MSRVLVTGASGFIGRGTLAPLLAAGHEVHIVTRREELRDAPPGVITHQSDLLAPGTAGALVKAVRPEVLLHLAWYAEPGAYWTSSLNLAWVEASLRLLREFAGGGGRRAVLAGSCAEYEWSDPVHCVEATTPRRPATLYGTAKHSLRILAERFARQENLSLAWGHVFFVFGPGEDARRLGGSVARALVEGVPAETSNGEQVRDFILSDDLAAAFVALVMSSVEGPVNLASGRPVRIRDLVQAMAEAAGRPDLLRLGARPSNPTEPEVLTAQVERLRQEVGLAEPRSLPEAARLTIDWWRQALRDDDRLPGPE